MLSRLACLPTTPAARSRSSRALFSLLVALALTAVPRVCALQVTLNWNDNSTNESGFKVERSTNGVSFAQIATTPANSRYYSDASVAANTSYTYRVRAYNSAGNSAYSNSATLKTGGSSGNTAPNISSISDRTIAVNGTTGAIAFTISDAQTSASSLTLIRNASNPSLVPLSNITFGGSGSNRTVTIKPASNKTGWSTIWIKVSDGQLTDYVSFKVSVNSSGGGTNTAPTISRISNQTITRNGATTALPFTINDSQTSAGSLTLIKNASNTSLIPLNNITLGGSGSNRTVTVKPASNKTGWSTVWLKVSDGQLENYIAFKVTVNVPVGGNTAPTISDIPDRQIIVNGSSGSIPFTIGDGQTSAASLSLVRNASNTSVIPLNNITFGGSGANRTVTIRPASNKTGWSTIWIKVSDGQLTDYVAFVVSVETNLNYGQIAPSSGLASVTQKSSSLASATDAGTLPADDVLFGSMPFPGDVELTVQVQSLAANDEQTRGGLMLRDGTAPDSASAALYVTGTGRLELVTRQSPGAPVESRAIPGESTAKWLRLTRSGDVVYGFASDDGLTWDLVEFATVNLPDVALGGTVVSSPEGASPETATFGSVSVD